MKFTPLEIPEVILVQPDVFGDARGFFQETYHAGKYAAGGVVGTFIQDNFSFSRRGVLRGLHYQRRNPQGKLVYVARGEVFDVAVDLRRSSPSFGRHVAVELSAAAWNQLWVPEGFAHGFLTLEPDCEVLYKVTDFYTPAAEAGLRFDDPALGIAWPVPPAAIRANARDRAFPGLAALPASHFVGDFA